MLCLSTWSYVPSHFLLFCSLPRQPAVCESALWPIKKKLVDRSKQRRNVQAVQSHQFCRSVNLLWLSRLWPRVRNRIHDFARPLANKIVVLWFIFLSTYCTLNLVVYAVAKSSDLLQHPADGFFHIVLYLRTDNLFTGCSAALVHAWILPQAPTSLWRMVKTVWTSWLRTR